MRRRERKGPAVELPAYLRVFRVSDWVDPSERLEYPEFTARSRFNKACLAWGNENDVNPLEMLTMLRDARRAAAVARVRYLTDRSPSPEPPDAA